MSDERVKTGVTVVHVLYKNRRSNSQIKHRREVIQFEYNGFSLFTLSFPDVRESNTSYTKFIE